MAFAFHCIFRFFNSKFAKHFCCRKIIAASFRKLRSFVEAKKYEHVAIP